MSLRDQLVQAYKTSFPTWSQGDIEMAVAGMEDDEEQMRAKLKQLTAVNRAHRDVVDLTQSPQRDVVDLRSRTPSGSPSASPEPPEALRSVTASPPPPRIIIVTSRYR